MCFPILTCFTICSSVAIIASTSVAIHIISTSTIYTWAGSTFINVWKIACFYQNNENKYYQSWLISSTIKNYNIILHEWILIISLLFINVFDLLTCFTIGSSVAIITITGVTIHIISTSTIYTWAGSTFIDVYKTNETHCENSDIRIQCILNKFNT